METHDILQNSQADLNNNVSLTLYYTIACTNLVKGNYWRYSMHHSLHLGIHFFHPVKDYGLGLVFPKIKYFFFSIFNEINQNALHTLVKSTAQ